MSTFDTAGHDAGQAGRDAAGGREWDEQAPADLTAEVERLRTEVTQLQQAIESRAVIDQARGMVMVMGRCCPEVAWEVLVEVSQHTNTKLRAVASALVATTDGTTRLPEPLRTALAAALRRRRPPRRRR